ncbi:hypothetical protein HBI02_091210 [Parastagonospora nodorum]|nr:hypothetical protein HBI02_091210 [Parastagonospora nodorum]
MQAIVPVLDYIESFSRTISIFVQSNPEIAALVWGSFFLVVQIAARFTNILETFLDMVSGMMKLQPRLEGYSAIYGQYPNFVRALSDLFLEYARFALRSLQILRKHPVIEAESNLLHQEIGVQSLDLLKNIDKQMPQLVIKDPIPFHQIKVSRNDRYFPRANAIDTAGKTLYPRLNLSKDQDRLHSFSIRGMGGVGKSQIAGEFAWSNRDKYDVIVWLRAENKAVLADDFSAAGEKLLAPGVSDQAKIIDMLREWLADTDYTWLLIFDNIEDKDVLNDFWPRSARGSILLTTRHTAIADITTEKYELLPLTVEDGKKYLSSLLISMPTNHLLDVEDVVNDLGGLPLALSQAAAYMKSTRRSCSQFRTTYREKRYASDINKKHGELVHQDYKLLLDTVFSISIGQLGPEAKRILSLMAFFDPDSIDDHLIAAGAKDFADLAFLEDDHLRRTALVDLSTLSLVTL